MKQALIYNEMVRRYNRSRRTLLHLIAEGKNLRKQDILQRRINRLFKTLSNFQRVFKLGMTTAALSAGMVLFQPQLASAQVNFLPVVTNPFGLSVPGYSDETPAFVDLDNDGDLDMMSGELLGHFYYFENTGTAKAPVYAAPLIDPFGLADLGNQTTPSFADLDNDGDMDMVSGAYYEYAGNIYYFKNTGTAAAPAFASVQVNPFGLTEVLFSYNTNALPTFVDLDNDGDFDIMAGDYYGGFNYYKNVGSPTSPSFAALQYNPFGLSSLEYMSAPAFADLDDDGDLDLLSGENMGSFYYFQNTGTSGSPAFAVRVINPFGLTNVDNSTPDFADLDNDGDMDLMSGSSFEGFKYFENTAVSCQVPDNPVAGKITGTSAKLKWDMVGAAQGYAVRYKVSNTSGWKQGNTDHNTKQINGLTPNTAYTWEVKTFCSLIPLYEKSDWSEKQYFTTNSERLAACEISSVDVYPNPLQSSAVISFSVAEDSKVQISLYDISGRLIKKLFDGNASGTQTISLSGAGLKGFYQLKFQINDELILKKVVVE